MHSLFQQAILFLVAKKRRPYATFLVVIFLFPTHIQASGHALKTDNPSVSSNYTNQEEETIDVKDTALATNTNNLEQLILESENLWLKDKRQSEKLILSVFDIINKKQANDSLLVRIYHLYGKILVDKHQTEAGIDTLQKCIEIKERLFGVQHTELADTYNYLGIGYLHLRRYKEAMSCFQKANQILTENKQVNSSLFDANLNMGIVKAAKGQYEKAYQYFNSALLIMDSIGPTFDSVRVARFYLNYGLMATLMGKFDDAIQSYSFAESIYKEKFGADYLSLAFISTNKGINAFYTYDYTKAKLYYKESLNVFLKNERPLINIARSYNNLSAVSIKTGDYSASVQYCLAGLKYNPDDYLKILIYQNLADSYAALGEIVKAKHYYLEAINLLLSISANPTKSISLYKSYADFLFQIKNYDKSRYYYNIALEKSRFYNTSGSEVYASLLSQLGDFYRISEINIDSSLLYYNQAIVAWNSIIAKQDTTKPGSFSDIRFLDPFLGKARSLALLYKKNANIDLLKKSCNFYQWALDKEAKISRNLDKENQLLLNEKFKSTYEEAIDIAYVLYKKTSDNQYRDLAFEFGERLKSSVLLAAVQDINALRTTDVPEQIVQSELQLQQEINGMKKLLVDEQMKAHPSAKKADFFNSRLLQLMISYDSLVNQIEQDYPRYFALKYDRSVINVTELTEQLQPDEVILEYVLTDSVLTLFAFGKEINHFSQIKVDTLFRDALNHLINIKNIDLAQNNMKNMREFISDANTLWNYLIAPVYSEIKHKRLIIVPDGRMGYLSFDLLLRSTYTPDELDYSLLNYLFEEFPISYSYSSSLLFNKYFKRKTNHSNQLIAFAPDYRFGQKTREGSLNLLPNSADEAIEVSRIYGGKAYLEEDATKSRFLNNALNYQVIHLAMHTIINDTLPMLSELLFYKDNNTSIDYKLHTYEVFGLNLSADLVVLSACNTGSGRLQKGEGIMSLARGFKYAGVPSILITLWEVQDKATAGIMEGFYSHLTQGESKDVALQKAKLAFLSKANRLKSHPYYWSSFLINGDTEKIKEDRAESNNGQLVFWGILLFAILLVAVVFLKKKSVK